MPRKILIAAFALLAVVGLVACGGGSKEDPQKVLDETFSGAKDYSSGVIDGTLTTGGGTQNFDATIKGPFVENKGGLPKFQFAVETKSPITSTTQLVSTGNGAYIQVQGTDYAVDQTTFNAFKAYYLGIQQQVTNPAVNIGDYVTGLSNEGDEDVAGVNTTHITGSLDVKKLAETARLGASAAGNKVPGLQQFLDAAQRTEEATFGVWSGVDDKRVHKFELHFKFAPSASNQGGTVDASVTLSDLGSPQTIAAPANAKPLSDLLKQIQTTGLGGGTSSGSGSSSGAGAATPTVPTAPSDPQKSAYLQCLSQAKGAAAIQACDSQLQ